MNNHSSTSDSTDNRSHLRAVVIAQIRAQLPDPAVARRRAARARRRQLRKLSPVRRPVPSPPATFGLSSAGILRHATELRAAGWTDAEIRERLADPRQVAA